MYFAQGQGHHGGGGSSGRTKAEQEAEDHRLAMQLQQEEERAAAGGGSASFVRQNPVTPPRRTSPPPAVVALEDADHMLALRLAGNVPQEYETTQPVATHRSTHHAPARSVPQHHHHAQQHASQAMHDVMPVVERKLSKEEQEAEDLRLAMELQELEEQGAGTTVSGRAAPTNHIIPYQNANGPNANQGTAQKLSLFSTVHRPEHSITNTPLVPSPAMSHKPPGSVAAGPSVQQPQPAPRRDFMDDLFASTSQGPSPSGATSVQNLPSAGNSPLPASTQPASKAKEVDFFSDAPSGQPTQPTFTSSAPAASTPAVWQQQQQPAQAAHQAPPTKAKDSSIDDIFGDAAPQRTSTTAAAQPKQPRPEADAAMQQQLDFFAAGKGNRW